MHNVHAISESHEQPPGDAVFTPDYTACARQDIMFIEITANDYMNAYRTAVLRAQHAERIKEQLFDTTETVHKKDGGEFAHTYVCHTPSAD
jgi:hypothetical protein